MIDGSNTDAIIGIDNTNNAAIDAENVDNASTDAENTDNDAINAENTDNTTINADNISNAATDGEKSDDATMSDGNTDNAATGDGNTDNVIKGKTSTVQTSLPLHYSRKTKDRSKIKTSTKHTPTIVEHSIGEPLPNEIATAKVSGHTFDPTDVCIYEFLIQGTPNTGLRRYRGGSITRNTMKYTR